MAHVNDAFILDPARLHFDTPAMKLAARPHGSGWDGRQTDLFQMDRPTYAQWKAARDGAETQDLP